MKLAYVTINISHLKTFMCQYMYSLESRFCVYYFDSNFRALLSKTFEPTAVLFVF